jgi:hypothetical protein
VIAFARTLQSQIDFYGTIQKMVQTKEEYEASQTQRRKAHTIRVLTQAIENQTKGVKVGEVKRVPFYQPFAWPSPHEGEVGTEVTLEVVRSGRTMKFVAQLEMNLTIQITRHS